MQQEAGNASAAAGIKAAGFVLVAPRSPGACLKEGKELLGNGCRGGGGTMPQGGAACSGGDNCGREFLIVFASGYGFGLQGRVPRSCFVPLAAGGFWAGRRAARGEGSAAPTASPVAHGRPPPHRAHQQLLNTAPTRTHGLGHAAKKNTSKLCRNSQLEERNYLRGNLARALPRCPAGGSHSTPSAPAAGAPSHSSLCVGSCLGKGPWCPRVPLLSPSPPASFCAGSGTRRTELAGRSSAAWKAAAPRQGARKRKHRREKCSGHPAGLPVSTWGFRTGP